MKLHDLTRDELRAHRRELLRHLDLMRGTYPTLDKRTAERCEATMANLMQQVYEIDGLLTKKVAA